MNDDSRNQDQPNESNQEGDQFQAAKVKALIDRRDRLVHPHCEDELSDPESLDYQPFLDEAYKLLNRNTQLHMSPYQEVRIEFLIGKYYEAQEAFGDAAHHFRKGAELAQHISDWALSAHLKLLESRACTGIGHGNHFYRAFEAARDALATWRKLSSRDLTDDMHFEFKLADNVGITALRVAEYEIAVDSLGRAGVLLQRLQGRPDVNVKQYANDDLFLTWDWVSVYVGMGDYRRAFKSILQTRRKAKDLLKPINKVRLQWLIAVTALGCAEQGPVEGYTRRRLLAAAGRAIDAAFAALRECDDQMGQVVTLLAEAKLLGMLRITDKRVDKINQAAAIAATLDHPILYGQVTLAWGDEHLFQGNKRQAKACYRKVEQEMVQLGCLELARIAQQRLARLTGTTQAVSNRPRRSSRKPHAPSPHTDLSLN